MGWNDHMDEHPDADTGNFPPEAFGNVHAVDGPFDPSDSWLCQADHEDQLIALRAWFLARYCDPAMETPYNSREGGYLYIHGGPFSPPSELLRRFANVVDETVIAEVADEMLELVGDEWAPIDYSRRDDYDDRFEPDVSDTRSPRQLLEQRLTEAKLVLGLTGVDFH
jgi:hypothetical protein